MKSKGVIHQNNLKTFWDAHSRLGESLGLSPEIPIDNGMAERNRMTEFLFCILPFRASTEMGRLQCSLLLRIRDAIRHYCGKVAFLFFYI